MSIQASCKLDEVTQEKEFGEFLLAHANDKQSFVKSGSLICNVIDTGAGMTQDQVSNIFRDGIQFNVNELVSMIQKKETICIWTPPESLTKP